MTLLETGDMPSAQRLRAKFPAGLIEMTAPAGLGPKRARILYDELGIDSLDALREAAANQAIRGVRGFGAKAEENMLASLAAFDAGDVPGLRMLLPKALAVADAIVAALRAHPASEHVELAGSARRLADSVKDLDMIATAHEPVALASALSELDIIESTGRATGTAGARAHPHRPARRPEDRRPRPIREPAPALHRLQAAQHGHARGGGAQGPARLRVRHPRRRQRRDLALRDRAAGLRAPRLPVGSPRAARGPRRARRRRPRRPARARHRGRPPR